MNTISWQPASWYAAGCGSVNLPNQVKKMAREGHRRRRHHLHQTKQNKKQNKKQNRTRFRPQPCQQSRSHSPAASSGPPGIGRE